MIALHRLPMAVIGRSLFALAIIGLGVEHVLFGEFVTGRAPAWPGGAPGRLAWAYVSGAVVVAAGITLLAPRAGTYGRIAALLLALLLLGWALVRHIPVVAADALFGGSWTRAGKALALVGGSLAVAATMPRLARDGGWRRLANGGDSFVRIGRACLGAFLVVSGVQHFLFTDFVVTLIPGWVPGNAHSWARFAGVALIAGGAGLQVRRVRATAAILTGLMIFSWVWIVHVPRVFVSVSDGIAVFEALAVSGLAFMVSDAPLTER